MIRVTKKKSNQGPPNNKPILIVVTVIVIVVLLVIFLVIRPKMSFAGQAFRPGIATNAASEDAKSVYFQYAEGFAAPGDADITIPLYVKADLAAGQSNIEAIQFCFRYNYATFNVRDVPITLSGWSRMTPVTDAGTYLASAGTDSTCPPDYTARVDIAINPSGTAIVSGTQIGELQLSVEAGAALGLEMIDIVTTFVSGSTGTGTYQETEQKESSTSITIVPACPDADGDTFPRQIEDGTLIPNDPNRDYRACPTYNAVENTIQFDCNDGNNAVHPGAEEICDGLDNDCDNAPDEDNYGMNDNQRGVCAGPKVCLGSMGLQNSYSVSDPTSQTYVRENFRSQIILFQGSREFFPFEKYEVTETVCDQLDNDCDGSIDEELSGCTIGVAVSPNVGRVSAETAGNVYIEYDAENFVLFPQILTPSDRLIYNLLYAARINTECGANLQPPCTATLSIGTQVSFCKNNLYYLTENNVITKYDPMQSSPEIVTAIQNCG